MTTLTVGEALALGLPLAVDGRRLGSPTYHDARDPFTREPVVYVELYVEGADYRRVLVRTDVRLEAP